MSLKLNLSLRRVALTVSISIAVCTAQSVNDLGVNGGSGPSGGIGDTSNPVQSLQSFITDVDFSDSSRKLQESDAPQLVTSAPTDSNVWTVEIDGSSSGAQQEMVGFGHSWTDSTVSVFSSLSDSQFDQVMKDLFGSDGNNMGLMRHTMGSSDLSGTMYSYDDNGGYNTGSPDPSLDNFDLTDDGKNMAQMMAKMGQYKSDVSVIGSPWSAPGWMKANGLMVSPPNGGTNGASSNPDDNTLLSQYYQNFAQYFAKYIDAFNDLGAKINAITPQNEPLNSQGGYPCMSVDANAETELISQYLGQLMKDRDVEVWAYDHNTDHPEYPDTVMQGASDYVQAAAWHCYAPQADYTVLSDFHNKYPDKLQFMTECTAFGNSFGVANSFMEPVRNWASGGTMWVLATDDNDGPHSQYGGCTNCEGSIIVHNSDSYTKTLNYYMVGQFSRYVRRGAINHNVKSGYYNAGKTENQFFVNSFKNPDGSWAVVLLNNLDEDKKVVVNIDGDTDGSSGMYTATVPKASLATWLIPSGSGNSATSNAKLLNATVEESNSSSTSSTQALTSGIETSTAVTSSIATSSASNMTSSIGNSSIATSSAAATSGSNVTSSVETSGAVTSSTGSFGNATSSTGSSFGNVTSSIETSSGQTGRVSSAPNFQTLFANSSSQATGTNASAVAQTATGEASSIQTSSPLVTSSSPSTGQAATTSAEASSPSDTGSSSDGEDDEDDWELECE